MAFPGVGEAHSCQSEPMSASEASGSVCMSSTQSAVLPMGVVKTTHSPAERAKSVCSSPCVRFFPEAKITQYEREKYLTSKGVSADELEFYCFKIGQKVTDTVSFEKAADAFLKERKPASVRVDMSAHVGGSAGGTNSANDAMNALIRGKFR